MKRLTALLLVLLALALPALAEPMALLDYTDDILEDGNPIYYFQELSLKLSADWRGKVMAMPGEGGVRFYQIASHEKYAAEGVEGGGFLFMLGASVDSVGEYTLKANFTPKETNIYRCVNDVDVLVKVDKAPNPTTVKAAAKINPGGETIDLSHNVGRNGATGQGQLRNQRR